MQNMNQESSNQWQSFDQSHGLAKVRQYSESQYNYDNA
jgi:hypothetical protein